MFSSASPPLLTGYIVLLTTTTRTLFSWLTRSPFLTRTNNLAGAQYVGVHFAALGVYTGNALLLRFISHPLTPSIVYSRPAWTRSWPAENISGQTKRAVGVALQITIGDLGAVTGVLLYRPAYAAHRFHKPHIIAIGYLTLSIVTAGGLWFGMARENRRRAEIIAAGKDEEVDYETKVLLGDRGVHWRYTV